MTAITQGYRWKPVKFNVAPATDTPVMSPTRAAAQLLDARRNGTTQDYQDTLATIAALASVSNVNATARLLELLTNAAADHKGTQS